MMYRTDFDLPTYVMAFAVGDFSVEAYQYKTKELSIWSRKGLPLNAKALLEETVRQVDFFSERLGDYPWEKYAIVLIPHFGGGMENVSITFNDEGRSSVADHPADRSLMAHELAHQWFGNWVTVKSWDDLWIKEGLATFLSAEVLRTFRETKTGERFTGNFFSFRSGQAIYDASLTPEKKFTSGPYTRAAWLLNQIRALIGEDKFWKLHREMLKNFAQSTISTKQYLDLLAGELNDSEIVRVEKALVDKGVPALRVELTQDGGLSFHLQDKGQSVVAPLSVSILDLNTGRRVDHALSLEDGASSTLFFSRPESSQIFSIDNKDIHPVLSYFAKSESESTKDSSLKPQNYQAMRNVLNPFVIPRLPEFFSIWSELSFDVEKADVLYDADAVTAANWLQMSFQDWVLLYDRSLAPFTRVGALSLACTLREKGQWKEDEAADKILSHELQKMPLEGAPWSAKPLSQCSRFAGTVFEEYWNLMENFPADEKINDRSMAFLSYLSYFNDSSLGEAGMRAWQKLQNHPKTLRIKRYADLMFDESDQ